ncbi:MAG: transglutaminase domain-containing protein [Spirochaetia bacterium]|nr:transglutaminase domain-containing protein [Spirochaetia bacterium]
MTKNLLIISRILAVFLVLMLSSCAGIINPYLGLLGYDEEAVRKQASYIMDYSGQKGIKAGIRNTADYLTDKPEPASLQVPAEMLSAAKKQPAKNLEPLVAHLVKDTDNDFLKVKILHDFLIYNVKYDYPAFSSNRIPDQSYISVFSRGTGVCAGYSALFKALCEMADIRCQVINGYGRGVGYNPADDNEKIYQQHAWNAVQIEGGWYFVEATWDSCNIGFGDAYSDKWLFPSPEIFSCSHLPDMDKWQLLERPVKVKEFVSAARLEPVMERILSKRPDRIEKISSIDGEILLILPPVNKSYVLTGIITAIDKKGMEKDKKFTELYIEHGNEKTVIRGIPPGKGLYLMRLFYTARDENFDPVKGFKSKFAGEACFDNKKVSDKRLPSAGGIASANSFTLIEPQYGPLTKGEKCVIHFLVQGIDRVYVKENNIFVEIIPINDRGEFIINSIPGSGISVNNEKFFHVFVKTGGKYYTSLVSFPVREAASGKKK